MLYSSDPIALETGTRKVVRSLPAPRRVDTRQTVQRIFGPAEAGGMMAGEPEGEAVEGRRWSVFEGPALALAAHLREQGFAGHAVRLSELLPDGPPLSQLDHHDALISALDRLSFDATIDDESARTARQLARGGRDLPTLIGRTGIAWIAWSEPTHRRSHLEADEPGYYGMHWADDDLLEDGPDLELLDDALNWARLRTDDILVRPAWASDTYFWAGNGPVIDDEQPLQYPHPEPHQH